MWIAEKTGTSIAMIQEHYGKYIRDDGDAPLRAYVETSKPDVSNEKTGTFSETFSDECLPTEEVWRPRWDLTPCHPRERPVSWAGVDDGDAAGNVEVTPASFDWTI